jgi:hypothetical protein
MIELYKYETKKSTGMSEGFMLNKTEEAKINKEEAGSTRPKKAHVITYGCKQNENDSEKIRGMLSGMGYTICTIVDEADVLFSIPARYGTMPSKGYTAISVR